MSTLITLISISLIFSTVAILFLLKYKKIRRNGVLTEGVVFDLKKEKDFDFQIRYPIIRFCTKKNEWVTEQNKIGALPGLYKKGAIVKIIYDPDKPSSFFIQSPFNFLVPILLLIASILLIIISILNY